MNQLLQWISELFQGAKLWTIILPWERGLRVRLGRWTCLWEPGFHPRIPFFDHVHVVNTRVRIVSVPCVTVTTKDGKTVTAAGVVAFRLVDPFRVLLTIQQPEDAASALTMAAFAEHIMARRSGELVASEIENAALDSLKQAPVDGYAFEFVKVVDFAIVRTYRLLQEQWRPTSSFSNLEPPKPI